MENALRSNGDIRMNCGGGGGGGNRRRGRPRRARVIETEGMWRCYAPCCDRDQQPQETVTLLPEEMEAFRLVDSEGLDQESAAERMHVSRRTLWRDVHTARKKVADALSEGKVIAIHDCRRTDQDTCILSNQEPGTLPQPEE